MKSKFQLLFLLFIIAKLTPAQNKESHYLNVGDEPPQLQISAWLKGEAVNKFEQGNIYVIEFWATWCIPCKAAMPRISKLAKQYKSQITILGIDIYEQKSTPLKKIKTFVDSMGNRMDYRVGVEKGNLMERWLDAFNERRNGIPRTFVIGKNGKVAWIGYPTDLDKIIPQIINNNWDIDSVLATRKLINKLEYLDSAKASQLDIYRNPLSGVIQNADSCLSTIHKIIKNDERLTYTPRISFYTFSSLLKTSPDKAYEYGKKAANTATLDFQNYQIIIDVINNYSNKLIIPPNIYELGADCYQQKIDNLPYPEIVDVPKLYRIMADWYWKANNKSKALAAEKELQHG